MALSNRGANCHEKQNKSPEIEKRKR